MSAPVIDTRPVVELPAAEQASNLNVLGIVRRRWPWVLVGIFVGIVGGLLAYTARASVYQSNAQLLVVKKRETLGQAGDFRMNYMEDYMSTQATIIKSEKVLTTAARKLSEGLNDPLPSELTERVKLLSLMFNVSREKDPSNPMTINNVLNVSVKASNPDDAQKILETIITAYRDEIKGVYDETTKERIDLLEIAIKQNTMLKEQAEQLRNEKSIKISKLTPELPEALQVRLQSTHQQLRLHEAEKIEIEAMLKQIEDAGKDNAALRALVFNRLSPYVKNAQFMGMGSRIDPYDIRTQIDEIEGQLTEMKKVYGPSHPKLQAAMAKYEFLKARYLENNPEDPDGKSDNLHKLEGFLQNRLFMFENQLNMFNADKTSITETLKEVIPIKVEIETLNENIRERSKRIESYDQDLKATELTRASGGYQANELNKPSREIIPVSPKLTQSLLLGIAAGMLFGVGLAALAELSDKGFRSPADIRNRLGVPVIGHIPPIRLNQPVEDALDLEPTLVSALRPKSVEAEAYRGVRTALYFNAAGSTHQMIQVTSPNQGDGKSTLAANLAVSIAQSGKRTLLVDCDMRRPRVHRVFHLADPGPGLAAVIGGNVPLSSAIQRSAIENLSLLPCGKKPANPAELLTSPNFQDLLDRLKSDYDYVILDTPPVLAVSDPSAVAPRADGVILVFRMTSRVRPLAERAREQLSQIGANVIGVVVNGSGRMSEGGYGGYGYGSEYTGYTAEGGYMENYTERGDSDEDDDAAPPKKG